MTKSELEELLVKATGTIDAHEKQIVHGRDRIVGLQESLDSAHRGTIDKAKEIDRLNILVVHKETEATTLKAVHAKMVSNAEDETIRQVELRREAESKYSEAISMFADLMDEMYHKHIEG